MAKQTIKTELRHLRAAVAKADTAQKSLGEAKKAVWTCVFRVAQTLKGKALVASDAAAADWIHAEIKSKTLRYWKQCLRRGALLDGMGSDAGKASAAGIYVAAVSSVADHPDVREALRAGFGGTQMQSVVSAAVGHPDTVTRRLPMERDEECIEIVIVAMAANLKRSFDLNGKVEVFVVAEGKEVAHGHAN